ncbi:MAG: DUF4276 family protein [Chloroflexi bacterium]|nr:DUF4276 family protein [Chloroflexota bacterium]
MPRLLIHVEGQTEETFVNEVLAPHLCRSGYTGVSPRLLGNARRRALRGGIRAWREARRDIVNHLREDPGCLATTMVDYYGLPQTGEGAWPGREDAARRPFPAKAATVERALLNDIRAGLDDRFDPRRFVPYVMMHEFEGMLFSDCGHFARAIGRPDLGPRLQAIRDQFATPEEINDSPAGHPSKRAEDLVPGYQKPFQGLLAVIEIGLESIRAQCPHFREWLERLEAWPR